MAIDWYCNSYECMCDNVIDCDEDCQGCEFCEETEDEDDSEFDCDDVIGGCGMCPLDKCIMDDKEYEKE